MTDSATTRRLASAAGLLALVVAVAANLSLLASALLPSTAGTLVSVERVTTYVNRGKSGAAPWHGYRETVAYTVRGRGYGIEATFGNPENGPFDVRYLPFAPRLALALPYAPEWQGLFLFMPGLALLAYGIGVPRGGQRDHRRPRTKKHG